MRTQINFKLEDEDLKKLDERANEEHRSRTNLIEKVIKEYLGKNYWLWVNVASMDIGDEMERGDEEYWSGCHKNTTEGDQVLIYRTSPHKHIKYLAEVVEGAKEDIIDTKKGEEKGYNCKFVVLESFENPLEIGEMRNYDSLSDWYPLKVSFIKMKFEIKQKYWNTLKDVLITKNPDTKNSFR
jgi:hypothetical protein